MSGTSEAAEAARHRPLGEALTVARAADSLTPIDWCARITVGSCTQVGCLGYCLGGKSSDAAWRTDW